MVLNGTEVVGITTDPQCFTIFCKNREVLCTLALFQHAPTCPGGFRVEFGERPDPPPPSTGRGPKSRKVLRKRQKKPYFLKSQILRLKQGFPLLAGPLFCESKVEGQGLSGDRPEPAEGGSGGSTTTIPRRGEGGWGGQILWGELKARL